MVKALLVRWVALALAFLVVDALLDDFSIDGGFGSALGLAVGFGLLSAIVGTVLRLLAIPLLLLTFGLFDIVINAVLLLLLDWLSGGLDISGFGTALIAAIVLGLVSALAGLALRSVLGDDS
jgi:putative membrane protein